MPIKHNNISEKYQIIVGTVAVSEHDSFKKAYIELTKLAKQLTEESSLYFYQLSESDKKEVDFLI